MRREPVGDVGLVAPVVKEGHVALPLRPAVRREESRELVELEVGVEKGDRLLRRLELAEDEGGLDGDRAEAKLLGTFRRAWSGLGLG